MEQNVGLEEGAQEPTVEQAEQTAVYDLHIKVPNEMRTTLRDAAELAYRLGSITKPDLVDLMNIFIGWGMVILKKQYLDRIGYR